MNEQRYPNGTRKGEFTYDYKKDLLFFKIKDRDYELSIEFDNFVIDIDTENFIMGIRIFDVSKVSGLDKMVFRNLVHGEFRASVKDNVITIRLNFVGKIRNKLIPIFSKEQNFTQQFSTPGSAKHPLADSEIVVPEIMV